MDKIKVADKRRMLEQKLQIWKNTVYDAEMDIQVAKAVGDSSLLETAKQYLKGAMKAVDMIGKMLAELPQEEASDEIKQPTRSERDG